jgi:uncharacterized membrane protein YesL
MPGRVEPEQLKSDLFLPWAIQGSMLAMLVALLIVCITFGAQIQQPLPEVQRVLIRTILYVVAIATLPMTNLLRHIQLRLNQTMPLSHGTPENEAKKRYLVTIIVSMSLIESVGIFGFVMFILGDNFNTLYIFSGLSALGMFLYRPKVDEYAKIVEGLTPEKT